MQSLSRTLARATVLAAFVCFASASMAGQKAQSAKRPAGGTGAAVVTAATGTGIVGASGRISSPVSVTTATGAVVTGVPVVACDSLDRCQATGLGAATAGTLIIPGTALVAGRTGAMESRAAAAISGTPAASPAGRFTSVAVLSPTGDVVYGAPILDCDVQNNCRPGAPPTDVAIGPTVPIREIATLPDAMVGRSVGK